MSTNPPTPYKPSVSETFRDLPAPSLGLLTTFLALDPAYHGTAASAVQNEFFSTSPLTCDLLGLPALYEEEDDDSVHPHESRKCKSKLKQRAKSHGERMMKFKQDVETPKTDDYSSKEDVKATDLPTNGQEPDISSTASVRQVQRLICIQPSHLSPYHRYLPPSPNSRQRQ